jgi:hypothetical protein
VDRDDVGVVQRRGGTGLAKESAAAEAGFLGTVHAVGFHGPEASARFEDAGEIAREIVDIAGARWAAGDGGAPWTAPGLSCGRRRAFPLPNRGTIGECRSVTFVDRIEVNPKAVDELFRGDD